MCFASNEERDCAVYGAGYICRDSNGDGRIDAMDGQSGCVKPIVNDGAGEPEIVPLPEEVTLDEVMLDEVICLRSVLRGNPSHLCTHTIHTASAIVAIVERFKFAMVCCFASGLVACVPLAEP